VFHTAIIKIREEEMIDKISIFDIRDFHIAEERG
jgi:hypothetical protein